MCSNFLIFFLCWRLLVLIQRKVENSFQVVGRHLGKEETLFTLCIWELGHHCCSWWGSYWEGSRIWIHPSYNSVCIHRSFFQLLLTLWFLQPPSYRFQVLAKTDCHNRMTNPPCKYLHKECTLFSCCQILIWWSLKFCCQDFASAHTKTLMVKCGWQGTKPLEDPPTHIPVLSDNFLGAVTCQAEESSTCIYDWEFSPCCIWYHKCMFKFW